MCVHLLMCTVCVLKIHVYMYVYLPMCVHNMYTCIHVYIICMCVLISFLQVSTVQLNFIVYSTSACVCAL